MNGLIKMPTNVEKRRIREEYNIPNKNSSRVVKALGFANMAEFYRDAMRHEQRNNQIRNVIRTGVSRAAERARQNIRRRQDIQNFQQNRAVRRIQQGRQSMRETRAIRNIADVRNAQRATRTDASVEYEHGRYAPANVRQWNLDFQMFTDPTDTGEIIGIDTYWGRFFDFKVLPLLSSIQRIFRDTQGDGRIGISVYGLSHDGIGPPDDAKYSYDVRKISDIAGIRKEWREQEFSQSKWTFTPVRIEINYIPVLVGGCSKKCQGEVMKLVNLKVHSPCSSNNNCLFKCIEPEIKNWKSTKLACNEVRKRFGLEDNCMISIEQAIEIGKFFKVSVGIFTNDNDLIAGEYEGKLKLLYLNEHYMTIKSKVNVCSLCKKIWTKSHKCREHHTKDFYIKRDEHKRYVFNDDNLPKKDNENKFILHYDIETWAQDKGANKLGKTIYNNTPYIVGCAYYPQQEDKPEYLTFVGDDCMKQFYDFLGSIDVKHIKYLNAYNGSNFDHYYLFQEMLKIPKHKVGKFILNNGQLLTGVIQGKKIWDLNRHIVGSLAANLESNKCQIAKGDLNHNVSKRWVDTPTIRKINVLDYLKADVMGLLELTEIMNNNIHAKFGFNMYQFITNSSMCDKLWSQRFLYNGFKCEKPNPKKEKRFRKSIYGGRTTKFKKYFKSKQCDDYEAGKISYEDILCYIFDADVVSLYPTVMMERLYPIGESKHTFHYKHGKLGIYKVSYKANRKLLVPVLPRKGEDSLKWDVEDGEGWYSSVDLENAWKRGYDIKIEKGYYWEESAYIFKDYIEYMFQAKLEAIKGTPAYALAKICLNALYGKQLQSTIRSQQSIVKNAGEFWKILKDQVITEMSQVGDCWLVNHYPQQEDEEESNAQKATQNGVFILSYSRQLMLEYYDKCGNTLEGMMSYCDTDSLNIHSSQLKQYGGWCEIDKNLGGIDDDVGGKVIESIWIAPKMYAFKYVNNTNLYGIVKVKSNMTCEEIKQKGKNTKETEREYNILIDPVKRKHYDKYGKIYYHYRGKGVPNNLLTWESFENMRDNKAQTFTKDFQFRKINTSKSSADDSMGFDFFTVKKENDIQKTVNTKEWDGRDFYHESIPEDKRGDWSVPWGYQYE